MSPVGRLSKKQTPQGVPEERLTWIKASIQEAPNFEKCQFIVVANMCLVSFMLQRSNENTTIMGRIGSEMEEPGTAFATIAFQVKYCMLIRRAILLGTKHTLLGTSVRKIGRLRQYDISLLSLSWVNI